MTNIDSGPFPSSPDPSDDLKRLLNIPSDRGEDLRLDGLAPTGLQFAKMTAECILRVGANPLQMVPESTFHTLHILNIFSREVTSGYGAIRPELSPVGINIYSALSTLDPEEQSFFSACALALLPKALSQEAAMNRLANYVAPEGSNTNSSRELRKLLIAIRDLPSKVSKDEVDTFFTSRGVKVLTDYHLDRALLSPLSENTKESATWLRSTAGGCHNDPPVGPEYRTRRERVFYQGLEVFRRSVMHSGAFWRLSGETNSLPTINSRSPALLSQFGEQCFSNSTHIFSSDPNSTPGRGFMFSKPKMNELFFKSRSSSGSQDELNRAAFKNLNAAYDEFPDAVFTFLRGMIVVYHPGSQYRLSCSGMTNNPAYVLVVHNDHLHGDYEYAQLVPVSKVCPSLLGAAFDPRVGPTDKTTDLAFTSLREKLWRSAVGEKPYGVDLSNISTIYGGLVSGLPYGSAPLFSWELDETPHVAWKDNRMRYHYGWLQHQNRNRAYQMEDEDIDSSYRVSKRDALLKPYEEASHQIYKVASGLFDLLDLFYHRYSAWKNDLTPAHRSLPIMLTQIYNVHEAVRYGLAPEDAPQLCIIDRFDFSREPRAVVDPITLTLKIGSELFQLPRTLDACDTRELTLWRSAVKSLLVSSTGETVNELAFIRKPYIPAENRI